MATVTVTSILEKFVLHELPCLKSVRDELNVFSFDENLEEDGLAKLVLTVARDPVLTARILGAANAMLGLRKRVTTLSRAVLILGIERVKELAHEFVTLEDVSPSELSSRQSQALKDTSVSAVIAWSLGAQKSAQVGELASIAASLYGLAKLSSASYGRLNSAADMKRLAYRLATSLRLPEPLPTLASIDFSEALRSGLSQEAVASELAVISEKAAKLEVPIKTSDLALLKDEHPGLDADFLSCLTPELIAGLHADPMTPALVIAPQTPEPDSVFAGESASGLVHAAIVEMEGAIVRGHHATNVARIGLEAMHFGLAASHSVLFIRRKYHSLTMRAAVVYGKASGWGDLCLTNSFPPRNFFHAALATGRDVYIQKLDDPKVRPWRPEWHRALAPEAESCLLLPLPQVAFPEALLYLQFNKQDTLAYEKVKALQPLRMKLYKLMVPRYLPS